MGKQAATEPTIGSASNDNQLTRRPLSAMIKTSRNYHRETLQQHRNPLGPPGSRGPLAKYDSPAAAAEFISRQQLSTAAGESYQQQKQQTATVTSSPLQDLLDVSLTTEPINANQTGSQFSDSHHSFGRPLAAGSSNRQHHSNKTHPEVLDDNQMIGAPAYGSGQSSNELVDLIDDIHTTRSSLAAASNEHQRQQQAAASYNGHSLDQITLHPQLTMQAPYGMTPATLSQLSQFLSNNREQQSSGSIMDADDIINLYSRMLAGDNSTENLLREYNVANSSQLINSEMLANLMGSASTGAESVQGTTSDPYTQQQLKPTASPAGFPTYHRGLSASLPISMLLGDILKLTRPKQQESSSNGNEQNASVNKPQSILQQLKAIPGPLIALLQGMSTNHNQHYQDHAPVNHEASESSQHFHQIPMSANNIQSMLTRPWHASGILPAFPAPKGVQQPWIPPTAGGNPDYHLAQNSNADFVASNVAGFVRATQQSELPQNSNEHNTYQHLQTQSAQQQQQPNQQQHNLVQSQHQEGQPQQQQQNLGYQRTINQNEAQKFFAQQDNKNGQQVLGQQQHQPAVKMPAVYNSIIEQQGSAAKQATYQPANPQGLNVNWGQQSLFAANQHIKESVQDNSNRFKVANAGNLLTGQANMLTHTQQHLHPNMISAFNLGGSPQTPDGLVKSLMNQQLQNNNMQVPLGYGQSHQTAPTNQHLEIVSNSGSSTNVKRRKRSVDHRGSDEVMSGKYSAMDEEDDGDSRPISVVRPDGQPTNSGRINGYSSGSKVTADTDRQVAQSQRTSNHFNLKSAEQQLLPLHYKTPFGSVDDDDESPELARRRTMAHQNAMASERKHSDNNILEPLGSFRSRQLDNVRNTKQASYGSFGKLGRSQGQSRGKKRLLLDSAGSGLMSKLLGVASNNDETEEDIDDDDDVSEKRKEELDDAEFGFNNNNNGISNNNDGDERQSRISSSADSGSSPPDPSSGLKTNSAEAAGGSGVSNTGQPLQAYSRRNQQRSDIEFYGHPGEETRTLKYGILGSGNYEVVNGGIYSDADESTAAVNSVANYVRKPGALLTGLPKLLADQGGAQSSYLPGTRMNNGFMRGASGSPDPDDLVSMMGPIVNKEISSPMLELIDAGGSRLQFDPSLMAQLGSSGSSARSTHATKDSNINNESGGDDSGFEEISDSSRDPIGSTITGSQKVRPESKTKHGAKKNRKNSRVKNNEIHADDDDDQPISNDSSRSRLPPGDRSEQLLDRQPSSISGSRSRGTNQFNSYQILPSKKVTIFSEKDLDVESSSLIQTRSNELSDDYERRFS